MAMYCWWAANSWPICSLSRSTKAGEDIAATLSDAPRGLGCPKMHRLVKMRRVKTRKRCCKSRPRCKRCPVVCKRLEKQGLAVRDSKRHWVLLDVTKPALKAARAR